MNGPSMQGPALLIFFGMDWRSAADSVTSCSALRRGSPMHVVHDYERWPWTPAAGSELNPDEP